MKNVKIAQTLTPKRFKRRFGVERDTFKEMLKALQPLWRPIPRCGAKPKLTLADQVLVTLEDLREYRTYFHIGSSWGVSESTICQNVHWVEDHLMRSGRFRLPGKKHLLKGFGHPEIVIMDVTETPIERPKHRQRRFYSGKKKQHPLKSQVLIDRDTGQVICLYFGKGRQHDFKLFQAFGVHLHPDTQGLNVWGFPDITACQSEKYRTYRERYPSLPALQLAMQYTITQKLYPGRPFSVGPAEKVVHPRLELLWGSPHESAQSDDPLAQIWCIQPMLKFHPPQWIVIAITSETRKLNAIALEKGRMAQEGTREYLLRSLQLMIEHPENIRTTSVSSLQKP
jgi:Helix-turn-helix of DDE superfamily endonuclease/DDE superfamily endonuclease